MQHLFHKGENPLFEQMFSKTTESTTLEV